MIINRGVCTCCTWTKEFVQVGFFVEGIRFCPAVKNVARAEDGFFVVVCADEKGYLDELSRERASVVFGVAEDDSVVNGWYEGRR